MLPDPNENNRQMKLMAVFLCLTLYVVVTGAVWHYVIYG